LIPKNGGKRYRGNPEFSHQGNPEFELRKPLLLICNLIQKGVGEDLKKQLLSKKFH